MVHVDPTAAAGRAALSGRFITFEGGDGVGKSTQVQALRRRLAELGIGVLVTREPGGTPRAERIREVLLGGRARGYGTLAEAALFAAARLDHLRTSVRPALRRGETVICDRFVDSSRVYQGVVGRLPGARLTRLETAATEGRLPDLTLVLDLPAAAAEARAEVRRVSAGARADRFEAEGRGYRQEVAAAFREVARAEPGRCRLIDAGGDAETVGRRVWEAVGDAFRRGRPHG